jgi:hypothetical protein
LFTFSTSPSKNHLQFMAILNTRIYA